MIQQRPQTVGERTDSRIATALFILLVAVILVGFAKNFYLRAWLGSRPLILTAWVHGIVMSAWVALFIAQVAAIARDRLDLHRSFGQLGAWLAFVVVAVGMVTIVVRARLVDPEATLRGLALLFVAFDGLSLLLFGALVVTAWRYRPTPAVHRRLMTMAMVALLPPAYGRLVAYFRHDHVEIIVLGLMMLTVLTFVMVDAARSHRLQRASWIPGLVILLVDGCTYLAQVYS
ncbi:MAG: hypothetical protein JSS29_01020 [Proteobacteria bacterium]|nr:hypothetical protein [Pseudomonadota bacterium]